MDTIRSHQAYTNILKLACAVAVAIISIWWYSGVSYASVVQVRIYSSLEPSSGLFDFGMHFDEGNVAFGARDWNFSGDGDSTPVYLRLNLYHTQTYYVRYHIYPTPGSSCSMSAKLAQYIGGQWIDIGGTELHFDHQTQISETWTTYIINEGESIGTSVGNLELCGTGAYHSHSSADVGTTSLMTFTPQSNDTCWTEVEYSFQCPGSFPKHYDCTTSSGTASKTGTISEYVSCDPLWSKQFRSTTYPAFYVWY